MPDLSMTALIKKYCGYIALGVVLVLLLGVLFGRGGAKEVYEVVCLGDSIMGNVRDESSIPGVLEQVTGKKVLNAGFGGMSLTYVNDEKRSDLQQDGFSLVGITESLLAEDFSWQKSSLAEAFVMDYYGEAIADLESVSREDVEVIVIEYGINDYTIGTPLDNDEMPYDKYTFGGALRHVLKLLTEEYGAEKILLCTPTFCWLTEEDSDCRISNGQGTLEDYVNLEKEIAEQFGVRVLDNYNESGIGPDNESWSDYTVDGLHLNEEGRRLIAERIAECIGK